MYATKRRQRNFKRSSVREPVKPQTSSNPSKRHRERLNGELETVAALLPYDQNVISRLDKLSVLRLAVSYLQVKTHFQLSLQRPYIQHPYGFGYGAAGLGHQQHYMIVDKSLCGFILILNENGEIFYASDNIETFLGFHQSDILHQPVYDMIHSEDRDEIRQQLLWNYSLPPSNSWQDLFTPDGQSYLERSASARFRCLLDNTCGFLRIDIRGRLSPLHGLPPTFLATRTENTFPVLGFIAICSPFVPPPNLDGPDTEPFLKTKHSLDFSLISTDAKARFMLEVDEKSLPLSLFSIIHPDDAPCMAEAHKEGRCGLAIVHRSIARKPPQSYAFQAAENEVEGNTLLEKRVSLSEKLLSFDDSLLQSPKLLQSTAALSNAAQLNSAGDDSSILAATHKHLSMKSSPGAVVERDAKSPAIADRKAPKTSHSGKHTKQAPHAPKAQRHHNNTQQQQQQQHQQHQQQEQRNQIQSYAQDVALPANCDYKTVMYDTTQFVDAQAWTTPYTSQHCGRTSQRSLYGNEYDTTSCMSGYDMEPKYYEQLYQQQLQQQQQGMGDMGYHHFVDPHVHQVGAYAPLQLYTDSTTSCYTNSANAYNQQPTGIPPTDYITTPTSRTAASNVLDIATAALLQQQPAMKTALYAGGTRLDTTPTANFSITEVTNTLLNP